MSRCPKCLHQMGYAFDCLECRKRARQANANKPKPLDKALLGWYVFDFGKHKGQEIATVPSEYLEWLESELLINKNRPELLERVSAELKRRA